MKTICAVLLLFAAGIYTIRTRFIQLRRFGAIVLQPLRESGGSKSGLSAFEAAATSLAATIGTGNIAGVAGAILLGGPGALFWIWISGIFGMGLKYAEVFISMRYRIRNADGQWRGGPMYWVRLGLSKHYQTIGYVFALMGMLAALGMGDLIQVSTVAEAAESLMQSINGQAVCPLLPNVRLLTGVLTAGILFAVLSGGAKRIGRTAALLVPFMSMVYLLLCMLVITKNHTMMSSVFRQIIQGAFTPKALFGGTTGIGCKEAFRVGLSRGVFSHEAGLGTAAIAHSCADHTSAMEQARYGAFEVFFDVLICSVTAIAILASGISLPFGNAEINSALIIDALSTCFGKPFASAVIAISLLLFAFTSMTGFALYGSRCAEFLFGIRSVKPFVIVFLLVAVIAPLLPRSSVWEVSEMINAFLCIPNLAAMTLLLRKDIELRKNLRDSA